MAVSLLQAQNFVQNDLQAAVIDEFRKSSYILDNMIFDDVVSPTGGGATLTYSYNRVTTQPSAGTRAINSEYTAQEAQTTQYSTNLAIMGGKYGIDRVIARMGGIEGQIEFQTAQKIKATKAEFNDLFINGSTSSDATQFNGLDVLLTGSGTEYNAATGDTAIDLSTSANITSNYMYFLDMLDEFLSGLDGTPDFIAGNTKLISKIRACARRASLYQTTKDNWGQQVEYYGSIALVDMYSKSGSNSDVIATGADGTTSLYVGRFGLDGLHGLSLAGVSPIEARLPVYTEAGAVKEGDVEMVAAIALKSSKAAGVFRKIKVSAASS